ATTRGNFLGIYWHEQPAKKKARRQVRQEKAAKMAPRPTQLLRPAVHCPTVKVRSSSRLKISFVL
ncbi:unnamed protein product, partial [Laminaria digitata]